MRHYTNKTLANSTQAKKWVVHLGTSMLAAGALLLPTLSAANVAEANAAPPAAVSSTAVITKTAAQSPAPNDLRKLKKSLAQLNLNAEQQQKVDVLLEQAQPQATDLQKNMRENFQQLRGLMYTTNYDAKEVTALADHQGELVSQMLILRAKLNVDIYKVLDAEQQQKLRTAMEEKAARKKHADKK